MPSPEAPLLEARGLRRRFGAVQVLAGLDLTLAPGEVLLILGANGAGKSTLLRILAGLARPDGGTVRVGGAPVAAARARVGFLAHDTLLYDDLTVRENLDFSAALHHGVTEAEVIRGLDRSGIAALARRRVRELSRGQQQRAALTRALLHAPSLLLLDEPYTGLDAASAMALTARLREEATAGRGIVLVGHQPEEGWEAVTRVGILARGQWAHEGPRPATPTDARRLARERADG